jgi:elongation factor P
MISTSDLRRGLTVEIDGEIWAILEYHHIKMGRGSAQVRMKMRNIKTGTTIERSVQAGEKFRRAILDRHNVQYLYREDNIFYFMDLDSFEQLAMNDDKLGDAVDYLMENMSLEVLTYEDEPVSIEIPNTVELVISETVPGVKGDTAAGGTKPAKLETGKMVHVPLFLNEGERIRVDTRTGQYIERA